MRTACFSFPGLWNGGDLDRSGAVDAQRAVFPVSSHQRRKSAMSAIFVAQKAMIRFVDGLQVAVCRRSPWVGVLHDDPFESPLS